MTSIWWRDLGTDSRTISWSSFIGTLRGEFGMPPAPPIPVMHIVVNPKEEEEEDPSEDPMDDEECVEAVAEQVAMRELEPPIPRGTQPIVISTQPRIIRTAVVPRGRPRGDGASTSRAPLLTPEDRAAIRE